jgi:hypothetical protein
MELFRVQRTRTFIEKHKKEYFESSGLVHLLTYSYMYACMYESAGLGERFFSLFYKCASPLDSE